MVSLRWFIRGASRERQRLQRVGRVLARAIGLGADDELSIAVCGDTRMRTLNRRFRGVDETTDVLAFPAEDDAPPLVSGDVAGVRLKPHQQQILGEVVINYRQVERQAQRNGNSVGDELAAVLIHGLVHLLGFDHDSRHARQRMLATERRMHKFLGLEVRQFGH